MSPSAEPAVPAVPTEPAEQEEIAERLRAAWGRRPVGIGVLTTRTAGAGGVLDLASTVTDITSLSLHPPLVLACLYSESRLRDAVEEGGTWALSLLDGSARARAAARQLAEPGRPLLGQLTGIDHRHGEHSGAALLDAATAWIECRTQWTRNGGDHDVIVGEVLDVQLAEGATGALVHHLRRITPLH